MPKAPRPAIIPIGPSIAYIPLSRELFALVDNRHVHILSGRCWHAQFSPNTGSYYAVRAVPKGSKEHRGMHSFITGISPTDHHNHETLNNMDYNLRPCLLIDNAANRKKQRNTSGFKGVCVEHGRYRASIRRNKKLFSLGTFVIPEDAARAYDAAALSHFGEFANLNFPINKEALQ